MNNKGNQDVRRWHVPSLTTVGAWSWFRRVLARDPAMSSPPDAEDVNRSFVLVAPDDDVPTEELGTVSVPESHTRRGPVESPERSST
ncbi:hypothetical protein Misp02_71310 [Microtetraspora sp. NBRC 16547]|nr:hypothetical protein Misp02_71310 [Microtetraspora sp. NBRC 16547]